MPVEMHQTVIERSGGRRLALYASSPRNYRHFEGLPDVDGSAAHMRQHPLTGEWVGYSAARQNRTFLPNVADCPLCAMQDGGGMTDVPVDDYEVAIFSNRFSALSPTPVAPPALSVETLPGTGVCEVICYSADHHASLSSVGPDRLALLASAIGARRAELLENPDISYVLPFENRGREIGVTIDHPHGQIYALSHLPERVQVAANRFRHGNPLENLRETVPAHLVIAQNAVGVAFAPEWARYPFEVWVVPHRKVASPAELTANETLGFAELLHEAAVKLDGVFDGPMPLTMSWQTAPRGYADCYHFHCVFQPLKRSKSKMKYLASVEQFTGFFLVDLPPERAADILNGQAQPDD